MVQLALFAQPVRTGLEPDAIRPFSPDAEPEACGELGKGGAAVLGQAHASGAADSAETPSSHDYADRERAGHAPGTSSPQVRMSGLARQQASRDLLADPVPEGGAQHGQASSPLARLGKASKLILHRGSGTALSSTGGTPSSSAWSLGSLAGKKTIRSILNARNGLRGVVTEVPIEDHGISSARSMRSGRSQGGSEAQGQTLRLRRGKVADLPSLNGSEEIEEVAGEKSKDLEDVAQGEDFERKPSVKGEESSNAKKKAWLWVAYNDLPDLPQRNLLGMTMKNQMRRRAVHLALNTRLELFWLFMAVVHFLIGMPEIQDNVFGCTVLRNLGENYKKCKYTIPGWHHIIFLILFTVEAAIKTIGFGLTGGKFAWWTHDQYNKLDIIALAAYVYETISVVLMGSASTFSLRGFRLMRLLKPLGQIGVFSDLETIFHAFGQALIPMATVLMFIWFVLVLFGIMGVAVWGTSASFRRRCVWADTLEIKAPEQYCKRVELFHEYPDCSTQLFLPVVNETGCEKNMLEGSDRKGTLAGFERQPAGLDNSCGPLQLCLDVANPNYGFTSFDHLPAALVTLFQVMSGDSDVLVLWFAIQSEPGQALTAQMYFVVYTFLVIHVLINVFVAVFANIFADSRTEHEEIVEMRRAGIRGADDEESSSEEQSTSSKSGSHPPSSRIEIAEVDSPVNSREDLDAITRQLRHAQKIRADEIENKKHFVGTSAWVKQRLASTVDPSLQRWLKSYFRDNDVWPFLSMTVALTQGVGLALIGMLCTNRNCAIDRFLDELITNFNFFFIIDQIIQVMCDGSLAKHFETGENIFNILITAITTCGLILRLLGLSPTTIAVLRGFAVFRLLRACKMEGLQPIWLMLVKTTGSLMSVMNLCLFNTLAAIIYFSIGRSLFQEALSDNMYYNYSSLSRGYMLLLTIMTGDSWSGFMYEAMSKQCTGVEVDDKCDNFRVVMTALYYMIWYFYGQFLFVTMFLAIILEAFAVEEFMSKVEAEDEEQYLEKEAAIDAVADFQKMPSYLVSPGLIKLAYFKLADGGAEIPESKLLTLVRMVQPMTAWRLAKMTGFVALRQFLRLSICTCLADSLLKPYPGDKDFVYLEPVVSHKKTVEEAEIEVATQWQRQIKEHMRQLVNGGLLGEVLVVAKITGILEHIDIQDLVNIEPVLALKLLRHRSISIALGLNGLFENLIEEALSNDGQQKRVGLALEGDEYRGLDLSTLENADTLSKIDRNDDKWVRFKKRSRKFSFKLVTSSVFESVMFFLILTSSIFLCLETPHKTIPGALPDVTLRLADVVFNIAFTVEFVAKSLAFGFYRPLDVEYMSYMQVTQNRIDLLILIMAIADMTPSLSQFIGSSTTKVIRLMKVMRPVRLLLRSEGLKQIIDALIASLKPMFFATLFLVIVIILFSVTGMAFFKEKFHVCTDSSLDGTLNQGKIDCAGHYYFDKSGYMAPRAWNRPRTGSHFDTLFSSCILLFKCLTLNWIGSWQLAQDSVAVDVQPVPGFSMTQASLYFHVFLLFGSFFGLNLFASFMCDTFYSLQGTAQLEEVQWLAVQKMLKSHQPKIHHFPPKNMLSTFLRQALGSSFWQNLSAFCLLLNVTFMGSMHSSQDSYFDVFMDTQNTVFFGIMCGEAGLHLISVGPTLYVFDPAHQFDLFLISATAMTMIFDESLRSFSQVTRILRLFKFLRALAKDKTISNVFETVLVSMGQVVNIAIILMVLLVMLSVLAVQLFGLVRPGKRLGREANFQTFGNSFHTVFQLMFGEDFPSLMDDCSISIEESYSCTETIFAPNGNTVVHMTDCGSPNALWFFPVVLVMTNYVMLNLFVGMIMNNFAYISTKDGNGAVEDEHFVDAAFKYVENLDPTLKGQIPIGQVYQFYNMIGPPLGNYGTTQNWGRFLCVREELRRQMNISEEDEKGWFYLKYYSPIVERLEDAKDANLARWKQMKSEVGKLESQYIAAADGNEEDLKRMGLFNDGDDGEDEEGEDKEGEQGEGAIVPDQEAEAVEALCEESIDESKGNRAESELPSNDNRVHAIGTSFGARMSANLRTWTETEGDELWAKKRPVLSIAAASITVSGSNMGAPVRKKTIKRKTSTFNYEATIVASQGKSLVEIETERIRLVQDLEEKLVEARQRSTKEPEPRPTMQIRFYSILQQLLRIFLSPTQKNLRKPGHVRYSEIILALLYWNKERNIVPQKLMENRKEKDDLIKFDVAFQIISGVCYGGLVRRRIKLLKQRAKDRLRRAHKTIAGGMDVSSRVSKEQQSKLRRARLAPAQDEAAKKNLWVWADDPNSGPIKTLCCKLAKYELLTGCQLADIAEEAGYPVKSDGIFELDERDLQAILKQSELLQNLFEHVTIIESMKNFIQEVSELAPAYLQLAAQNFGIDIGDQFEHLTTVPVSDLKRLLADRHVRTILPASLPDSTRVPVFKQQARSLDEGLLDLDEELGDTGADAQKHDRGKQLRKEMELELSELRDKHREQEQRGLELNLIIEYTQKRASTMASDIEQRREESRLVLEADINVNVTMKAADRGSMLAQAPTPTLPQVMESPDESEVLQIFDIEGGCEEHKRWEDHDDCTMGDFDLMQQDRPAISMDMDQVQNIYVLPEIFDGKHASRAESLYSPQHSRPVASAMSVSAPRPETAPEASNLAGFDAGEDSWSISEVEARPLYSANEGEHAASFQAPIAGASLVHRPVTAPEHHDLDSLSRLEEAMQITQAEIDRLQRQHTAGMREQLRQKKARMAHLNQETSDEATGLARARRDQKHQHAADSESTSSGLLSPRDKPTRKELLRREEARKQRAAEERINAGQSRGSSRASSRQGSRPVSRSTLGGSVGITF